jgi:hypothetical protein
MVKHGALSKSHVHQMLASKDARVRRAAYTLLEASNPTLRRNSELFLEIIRFIWEANPSYDVYREFNKRHLLVPYKVHELISGPPPISAPPRRAGTRADFSNDCLGAASQRFDARVPWTTAPGPIPRDPHKSETRTMLSTRIEVPSAWDGDGGQINATSSAAAGAFRANC